MAYSFDRGEPVRVGVVRIVDEELDAAIHDLTARIVDDAPDAVHECRKRCKKVRAVARLVRPALGKSYITVNQHARDAARLLSHFRDATALAQTFATQAERLVEPDHEALSGTFEQVGSVITDHRTATEAELAPDHPAVRRALGELEQLRALIGDVELHEDGWEAIAGGLAKTYQRGRKGLARAVESPTPEQYHEWRKRVKYTRHHMQLLGPAAPELLDPLEDTFHDLSDLLGDAHDLAVIGEATRDGDAAAVTDVGRVTAMLDGARGDLERRSVDLGRRLYAESPKRFTERIGAYWSSWR